MRRVRAAVVVVVVVAVLALAGALTTSGAPVTATPLPVVAAADPTNRFVSTVSGVGSAGSVTAHAGATNIFVEWDPVAAGQGYRMRHRVAGRAWRAWAVVPVSASSRNVTGLARATAYEIEFQVRVAGVWGVSSPLALRTRPTPTDVAVTAVTAEATVDRVMVAWLGGQPATQFRVAVSRNGGADELVASTYRRGVALDLPREAGESLVFAVNARVNGRWAATWTRGAAFTVPAGGHAAGEGEWVRAADETAGYTEPRVSTRYSVFDPFLKSDPMWGITRMGFLVRCPSVGFAAVDPIVGPGVEPTAHLHEFFGNPAVTPASTTQQLADVPSGSIACSDVNDKSAYWSPAVYQDGRRTAARAMSIYYKSPTGFEQPIPFGLRMVAGDPAATANQGSHIGWWEADGKAVLSAERAEMIRRSDRDPIALRVNFPQCWDGVHLDSPDHRSHLTYSVDTARLDNHFYGTPLTPEDGNGCPASHPVRIPQVTTFTSYDVDGGEGFALASGPWYTFHQDFWNVWSPDQMAELVSMCGGVQRNMCRLNMTAELQALGQTWVFIPPVP